MKSSFELCLFSVDPSVIRSDGIETIVVDWETKGKRTRQRGFNTQINYNTVEDLQNARDACDANILCRINAVGPSTPKEIHNACEHGADEILIPMVRTVEEVQRVLEWVNGQIGVGILIETNAAIEIAAELTQLPLSRIYVGLNDLAIENRSRNIFTPLIDGTIERVRALIDVPFGVAGLTLPEKGYPIPCRLLIAELMRLDCQFSFLRRSFLADVNKHNLSMEVKHLQSALAVASKRSFFEIQRDHEHFVQKVELLNQCEKQLI